MTKKIAVELNPKVEALAKYLEVDPSELESSSHDDNTFELGSKEYMVLTDEEADEKAADYIKDSAWAFNKSFLDGHSEVISALDDESWKAIVSRCESSNSVVLRLIDDVSYFIDDAIAADGRGHFLNTYDDEENEMKLGNEYYFIYRIN